MNPHRAERLAFRSNRFRCKTKKAYKTEAAAWERIQYLKTCGTGIAVDLLTAYQCRFDPTHWHVGHRPHYITYLEAHDEAVREHLPSTTSGSGTVVQNSASLPSRSLGTGV